MIEKSEWRPLDASLTIAKSKIEGIGLYAASFIAKGTDLGMSHIHDERFPDGYIRLPLGGFVNHHEIPNSQAVFFEKDPEIGSLKHIRIITTQDIHDGEEITIKYVINKLDDPNWEFEYETTQ